MSAQTRSAAELFSVAGSAPIYDGRVIRVRVDEVVMPGGGTAAREVVGHDRAVVVVALGENPDDADDPLVVLIEQYRHPIRRRLWELPAGLMDVAGEQALAAAQRELAEETGLAAVDWQLLVDCAASPGFTDEVARIYLATGLYEIGRQGEITDEEADLTRVMIPLSRAVQGVFDGSVVNSATVSGLLATTAVRSGRWRTRPVDSPWAAGVTGAGPGEPIPAAPALD